MFSGPYATYIIITLVFAGIGMLVSNRLKSKFRHYAQVPMTNGLSGAEVAAKMLTDYNIRDVRIVMGQGFLSDHYNPQTKTVSLSPEVFQGRSVAAAAVASHECGHAVQHAEAYTWLTMRSKLVPVVQLASRAQGFLLMFAFGGLASGFGGLLFQITVVAFLITTLFSFVTLPVEFDASKRALAWLDSSRVASGIQHEGAKDALWWAAMTYVVAALSALTVLLWLLLQSQSRR
ncbi:zinc metallopeptidase [Neolewinella lacunae]|uniref:Zinc metallopeptidase n=1 Tax=Neolewinella lacunae TaxID=1517758 RepID=A0A923PP36_9BACT|nr:zinc metallopeptidase [Neolewinella lacunae]MBC6996276.1 zinc metallopeptidase [Neolewinella lacunae]MDN3636899.1 zinc metallopeptidase [Neolewinella lacunae]